MPSRDLDAFRASNYPDEEFIGDGLSEQDLDDLWAYAAGYHENVQGITPSWFRDKPHQILYRLVLRLTRAELYNAQSEPS